VRDSSCRFTSIFSRSAMFCGAARLVKARHIASRVLAFFA